MLEIVNSCRLTLFVIFLHALLSGMAHAASVDMEKWKQLLHFSGNQSDIESESFFLSPNGRQDYKSELDATILSFKKDGTRSHCQFPARYLWLKKELNTDFGLTLSQCREFEVWQETNQVESVSLVFVTGYLGNPASYFGHLLMKFNRREELLSIDTPLLDRGINFGAETQPNDNPIKYVTYGLFGGYSASFTEGDYFQHENIYAEGELRELWDYQLNLTDEEVRLLEAHLWELKHANFRYYFLNGNCATYMARFINIVLDEPLIDKWQPWDLPTDIFHRLPLVEHRGEALVRSIQQRESLQSRFVRKYHALNEAEKEWVHVVFEDTTLIDSSEFKAQPSLSKAKEIDVLLEYNNFKLSELDPNERAAHPLSEVKRSLLLSRLSFQQVALDWPPLSGSAPHLGQKPQRLHVAGGYNAHYGEYASLSYRVAYYDFLALETARYPDSNASFLETEVRVLGDDIWLSKFELFDVATLNTQQINMDNDNSYAWQTSLALEPHSNRCRNCLRTRWKGYFGQAISLFDATSIYAMAGVSVDFSYFAQSEAQLRLGALIMDNELWKSHLMITPAVTLGSENKATVRYRWSNRFGGDQHWDVRMQLDYDQALDSQLSFNYYF